jgi:hypothetical protein
MHREIVAILLIAAGGILLVRQIYRIYRGKGAGCSCSRLPESNPDEERGEDQGG